ncbi:MAG: hypothetical protein EOP46_04320 [Sphingobacteriaceae bacterium]|nr:MAG: hypothetical protein EOP46_04320 [Sphingobacteriaceae bacterium]
MQAIAPAEMLQLWEAGGKQTLIERSLLLLAKALPQQTPASLALLNIGERDSMLLLLREYLFGTRLKNTSACPKCAEVVEWENDTRHLHLQPADTIPIGSIHEFVKGEISIKYRLPDSNDLMKVTRDPLLYLSNPHQLLQDCIVDMHQDNKCITLTDLDNEILEGLDNQISEQAPQADISMMLSCPACRNQWEAKFDIISYLWVEIDVWATHLLHEIYLLASAFGWDEADILNMSGQRRAMYVKLIQS